MFTKFLIAIHSMRVLSLIVVIMIVLAACESAPELTPTTVVPPTMTVEPSPTLVTIATQTNTPLPTLTPTSTRLPTSMPLPYPPNFTPPPPRTVVPPTRSPTPTATRIPIPTIVPSVRPASADHLPPVTYDLLFVSSGKLMRWNRSASSIETLATDVTTFSASADGHRAELRRRISSTEEEIAWLDLRTRQETTLAHVQRTEPYAYYGEVRLSSISPDGRWVAYLARGSQPSVDGTPSPTIAPILSHSDGPRNLFGMIYAVRLDKPNERIEVGFAAAEQLPLGSGSFGTLLWSPDSRSIVWSDARGVWLAALGQPARLLINHKFGYDGPVGSWGPLAWSPSGRYLLSRIQYYEGAALGVLDTQTGGAQDIPDTILYLSYAEATWLQDERLFVVRGISSNEIWSAVPATADFWRLESTGPFTLTREISFRLASILENVAIAPKQLADGSLVFALTNSNPYNYLGRGLFTLNLERRDPNRLTDLPPPPERPFGYPQVVWLPDGSGAIVHHRHFTHDEYGRVQRMFSHAYYAPTDSSVIYDLNPVIGGDTCCFMWARASGGQP